MTCARLRSYSSYLDKAGTIAVKLAEKLLKEGDIEVVDKHSDARIELTVRRAEDQPVFKHHSANLPKGNARHHDLKLSLRNQIQQIHLSRRRRSRRETLPRLTA